jgi:hypothetical protein
MTPDPAEQRRVARNLVRRAALDLARAQTITRPACPGAHNTMPDVEPLAALTASRGLEVAAREHAASYVRAAREAGHTWHDIGAALGLVPVAMPSKQARVPPRPRSPTRPGTRTPSTPAVTAARSPGPAAPAAAPSATTDSATAPLMTKSATPTTPGLKRCR